MALVKEHTPGHLRYLTYWLIFPKDKDMWVDQICLVHPLQWELKRMRVVKDHPGIERDLLVKGEASFKDHNGVKHRLVIEEKKRPRLWGKNQGYAKQ